jgi:hypothetical protein
MRMLRRAMRRNSSIFLTSSMLISSVTHAHADLPPMLGSSRCHRALRDAGGTRVRHSSSRGVDADHSIIPSDGTETTPSSLD